MPEWFHARFSAHDRVLLYDMLKHLSPFGRSCDSYIVDSAARSCAIS